MQKDIENILVCPMRIRNIYRIVKRSWYRIKKREDIQVKSKIYLSGLTTFKADIPASNCFDITFLKPALLNNSKTSSLKK